MLKLDELGLRYIDKVKKLHDSINNILNKYTDNNSLFKGVEILLSSGKLKPISDLTISNIGNVDLYRKILEKLTTYDESKSTSSVINEFASKLLSNCGEKCIGHAMELFHKNVDFKNQIEPFKSKFHIAEIVNQLLTNIYVNTNAAEITPLEEKIFKHLVYDVEATKQIKISLDTDCINKVQDKFHKAFYGEILYNHDYSSNSLRDEIWNCYDHSKYSNSDADIVQLETEDGANNPI